MTDFRSHYESLTDDELLRVWSNKDDLTELALTVLSAEITKRKLLDDPASGVRLAAFQDELRQNQARFRRAERRMFIRAMALALPVLAGLIFLLIKLLK